ncbi:MAG: extracellular solute-binding protein [Deltaproteobacteria bacterium]|nr:extracellular solute-binding protein [Deltaproteobacteria bacterium]
MKKQHAWQIVLMFFCLFLPAGLAAQPLQKIVEEAKKEGKLLFYTVLSLPESQALIKGFHQKYPFIQPELFRLGAEKMRTKILTEARAGRHLFDVTSMAVVETGMLHLQRVLGAYKASARDAIPAGLKDDEGYWTGIYVRQFVLAYDTRQVSEKDAPRDWWDLLDPKRKGKIGMDEQETEWYAALVEYWGTEKAKKFMRGLAAQNPVLHRGHTLIANLLVAGEFPLAIAYASRIEEMKAKGAPVDWVDTMDPIVVSPSVISLAARAPHPNAARLFIEYVLSREGQTLLQESFRVMARTDVPPLAKKLDLKRLRASFVNPKIADRYADFQKDYNEIFKR